MRRVLAITAACLALPAAPSIADDSVHLAMSNRIGLIAYCQSRGLLDEQTAGVATARIARARDSLAAGSKAAPAASAKREGAGRQGKWGSRGMAIEAFAPTLGLTVAQFCAEQAD